MTNQILQIYFLLQIVLAVVLGGLLGWQRERRGKSAGPRTYALVSAGSALFTILSQHGFPGFPATVASSIVVGIGFLGAGLIYHRENHVDGLTTAAGLWVAAAIGMAAGAEFYFLAIGSVVLMLFVFMLDDRSFRKDNQDNANAQRGRE